MSSTTAQPDTEESKIATGQGEAIKTDTRSKYTIDDNVLCHELRRKLWDGQLPLKIDLSLNDILSSKMPSSFYVVAPRENYFYYILHDVKQAFDQYGPPEKLEQYDEMWFEYNGQPLKWNLPVGAQFDTLFGSKQQEKQEMIPWTLTFHYKDSPLKQCHFFQSALKSYQYTFLHALKEALCIRVGDANEILQHQKKDDQTKMIREGLFKNNYETFWEINHSCLLKPIADFKRYAIRVLANVHHTYVQLDHKLTDKPLNSEGEIVSETDQAFVDWQKQEQSFTIGEVLMDAFPALFSQDMDTDEIEVTNGDQMQVLTHGVAVNLKTPIYWAQMNLSYPDGFIYLSFNFSKDWRSQAA